MYARSPHQDMGMRAKRGSVAFFPTATMIRARGGSSVHRSGTVPALCKVGASAQMTPKADSAPNQRGWGWFRRQLAVVSRHGNWMAVQRGCQSGRGAVSAMPDIGCSAFVVTGDGHGYLSRLRRITSSLKTSATCFPSRLGLSMPRNEIQIMTDSSKV